MKIFIIEDEPAIREELVQLLQKYGYQCDSSDDFHHIVQAALSSGANLILLDINLLIRMVSKYAEKSDRNPIFLSLYLPAETAILTN